MALGPSFLRMTGALQQAPDLNLLCLLGVAVALHSGP